MPILLLRYLPYLAVATAIAVLSAWATHRSDSVAYSRLQTTYASYQAQVATQHAKDEEAARNALQDQIDQAHATDTRNEAIIHDLQSKADTAAADLQFARRLLAAKASGSDHPGHSVPQAADQPGAPAAGQDAGDGSIVGLVADAAGECRANARQLNALIEELKPQL